MMPPDEETGGGKAVQKGAAPADSTFNIKSPGPVSTVPDKYTKKAPDLTAPYADNRVFFIDTKFFKYGTTDQGHAAALVLSAFLLTIIFILGLVAVASGSETGFLQVLISPFSLVAGVAVGKSLGSRSDKKDD